MLTHIRPACAMLATMLLLTGLAYPLAMTGIASVIAPRSATGSLIVRDDSVPVGSALIGQGFTQPAYLHPRPSAVDYDAAASGASNLGPSSAELRESVKARRDAWETENSGIAPIDAVTASASGLDPDISPQNARGQARRIAEARGVDPEQVLAIIDAHIHNPLLGIYGQPRVNVLMTNLALDAELPAQSAPME
ncbi:potassium-transporting ATPase subunit KdpC [Paracoccus saliphilus]|uniref:Potassium-transporting ATPase KdpC subunit n=1 Tax=Paracoccus saliphilus TaxID=405559 RepID=A0AA45W2V4_9RHOB|nr:potassium-transporting ATPase subunit KdpC [Paracoccus saliphilus]WCR05067.1 potassium-transporting ATPase subunit KdpC [Paracoccus saliphilus]SIS70551.1 K+-transporting ATPase ATPase C chain [Paracoccus saliphilus]